MNTRPIADLNALPPGDFAAALAPVWENADWVAEKVSRDRPFMSAAALHDAMLALVKALPALIPVKNHLLENGKIRIEPR